MQIIKIPKNKKSYLDVIKLLAIGMVVFNHTGNAGYMRYIDVSAEPIQRLLMCFSAVIKCAVPLFFMTSGALLLQKDESYCTILFKRVLRFVLVLLAVSFVFYYRRYGMNGSMSAGDFLIHVYRNSLSVHLWYLYSYICYMLMLPFLRKLAKSMGKREYMLLIVFALIAEMIQVVDYALFQGKATHTYHLSFFIENKYVIYPLMGYYINQMPMDKEREETPYVLIILSVCALLATTALMYWRRDLDGGWTGANGEAYMEKLVIIPTITIFYCVRRVFSRIRMNEKTANVLFVLGSCTFGVYLFDPLWREYTQAVRTLLTPTLGKYFASHVHTLCACILGLAATFAFKCIVGYLSQTVKKIWG